MGAGGPTAETLLRKFCAYVPLTHAISLAIYIVQEVKRLVPHCGLDTDVLYVRKDCEPGKLVGEEVREIENAFRRLDKLECSHFHQYIGSDLTLDPRTKPPEVKKQTDDTIQFFRDLNEKLNKRLEN